ncbi:calcium-binding protein [Sneathiella litorea]|uniref:Cadherin domain-containing protein n=1 Tax=Sneathiella litorea TaxID=2606216 RepID=A0A6L8WE18_9PROT|nr:calcium-binding protein [Sneathiella litorea]MZR32407.1 hypothetical protein [Sneathiella litorea]
MSSEVSDAEKELLEQYAKDLGVGVVNLGRENTLFPVNSFTLSSTFELNSLTGDLQSVLWNPRQYGIHVKNDDLKISLREDDGTLHTTTIQNIFNEAGWHDVQVVLDAEVGSLIIWLDGAVVFSGSGEHVALTSSIYSDVKAGGWRNGRFELDGQVASVTIADEALEIDGSQSLFDRMTLVSESDLRETFTSLKDSPEPVVVGTIEDPDAENSNPPTIGNTVIDDAPTQKEADATLPMEDEKLPFENSNDDVEIAGISVGAVGEDGYLAADNIMNEEDTDVNAGAFLAADEQVKMEMGTAGVPIDLALSRDYELIFKTLSDAGINAFLPLTIYQEIPEIKSLHLEADFFPPPFGSATTELYDLARQYGIKIAFSADIMYPVGTEIPSADADPLMAIIAMGGRDIIHSVINYDEPVYNGLDPAFSQAVYEHVKSIDSTLNVQQIHAPVGEEADQSAYLQSVLDHAEWADTVGFDVYPVGAHSGAKSPHSGGQILEPAEALKDYVSWLDINLADKEHVMVLQAFEIADLYSTEKLGTFSAEERAMSREPTEFEMYAMLEAVSGVDSVFWFGPSFQAAQSASTWQGVLTVSEMAMKGTAYPQLGELIDIDSSPDIVNENAGEGSPTGIQLAVQDSDAIDAVTYVLDDDRFFVDELGIVRVAEDAFLDFEVESSISFTATARSADGSESKTQLTLQLNDVADVMSGTSSSDYLVGGEGADEIRAYEGDDLIGGFGGDDLIFAGDGADVIYGGSGNDTISGGSGKDAMVGEAGNDELYGDGGNDYLAGGDGDDIIAGGDGQDELLGDAGDDRLSGNLGDDALMGGEGRDTFVFAAGDGTDYIVDFDVRQDHLQFQGEISFSDLTISGTLDHTQITYGDDSIILLGVTDSLREDIDIMFG